MHARDCRCADIDAKGRPAELKREQLRKRIAELQGKSAPRRSWERQEQSRMLREAQIELAKLEATT